MWLIFCVIKTFKSGSNLDYQKHVNFITEEDLIKINQRSKVDDGDILMPMIGTIGKPLVVKKTFEFAIKNVALIKFHEDSKVLPKYVCYVLDSSIFKNYVEKENRGGTQKFLSLSNIRSFKLPVPTIEVQNKIIQVLDKARFLINKRQSQITALDELTQSLFLEMFGDPILNNKEWDIRNFDEFAIIDTKMTNDFDFHADQFHIGIDNIEKNTGRIVNLKRVSESTLTSGKYIFNSNHVIYSKIRPYLNKVALPNFSGLCSADAYPLLPKENKCTRHFLAYILRSDAFLNHVSQNSDRTNIPKVNKKQLQLFNGILPPVELQLEFEDNVREIENKRNLLIKALKEMDNLYNSLLQKAFKGELF